MSGTSRGSAAQGDFALVVKDEVVHQAVGEGVLSQRVERSGNGY